MQRKGIFTLEKKNRNIQLIVDTSEKEQEFAAERDAEEEVSGGGFWGQSKQKAFIWARWAKTYMG